MGNNANEKVGAMQLSHPGAEHLSGKSIYGTDFCFKEWNNDSHKRKYVRQVGTYITPAGEKICDKPIDFWCEWEPESICKNATEKECKYNYQFPKYIHYPIFIPKSERKNNSEVKFGKKSFSLEIGTNTDPFVFGGNFYYTCCKRESAKHLKEGSVILFGSSVTKNKKRFFIDTVFVVSAVYKYGSAEYKEALKDKVFKETVLDINTKCGKDKKDIIVGATYDKQYNGMFSFFPCHASTDSDSFDRFTIDDKLHSGISKYVRNVKNIIIDDETEVQKLWKKLVERCMKEKYCLGIKAISPQKVCLKNNTFDVERIVNSIDKQIKRRYNETTIF